MPPGARALEQRLRVVGLRLEEAVPHGDDLAEPLLADEGLVELDVQREVAGFARDFFAEDFEVGGRETLGGPRVARTRRDRVREGAESTIFGVVTRLTRFARVVAETLECVGREPVDVGVGGVESACQQNVFGARFEPFEVFVRPRAPDEARTLLRVRAKSSLEVGLGRGVVLVEDQLVGVVAGDARDDAARDGSLAGLERALGAFGEAGRSAGVELRVAGQQRQGGVGLALLRADLGGVDIAALLPPHRGA